MVSREKRGERPRENEPPREAATGPSAGWSTGARSLCNRGRRARQATQRLSLSAGRRPCHTSHRVAKARGVVRLHVAAPREERLGRPVGAVGVAGGGGGGERGHDAFERSREMAAAGRGRVKHEKNRISNLWLISYREEERGEKRPAMCTS